MPDMRAVHGCDWSPQDIAVWWRNHLQDLGLAVGISSFVNDFVP
jgi:hypothetical protein